MGEEIHRVRLRRVAVGMDNVSPVCDDYADRAPFPFTGKFESVIFKFGDYDEPSGMDRLKLATKLD